VKTSHSEEPNYELNSITTGLCYNRLLWGWTSEPGKPTISYCTICSDNIVNTEATGLSGMYSATTLQWTELNVITIVFTPTVQLLNFTASLISAAASPKANIVPVQEIVNVVPRFFVYSDCLTFSYFTSEINMSKLCYTDQMVDVMLPLRNHYKRIESLTCH
jgi:hypothetical protein